MTLREFERRAAQRRRSDPAADREIGLGQFRILSFAQWCALNGISPATGRRLLKSGQGPTRIRLSDRRIGISVAANAAWQEARAIIDHQD
jgi:predicted DNA-binding transcriptional regulator AlpA